MTITTCIFDAYGTLFDVDAAARVVAAEPGQDVFAAAWPKVSADWRAKQLAYTWLRAAAGQHVDFWQVTQDGLDYALETAGLADLGLRQRLLDLYWKLSAYPEVPAMLKALKAAGYNMAILSNGSEDMLTAAVRSAGLQALLDDVLTVTPVGVFKPHPSVYQQVLDRFACREEEVLFVSSNGWDAAAAAGFGFRTVWVNRAGLALDRLWAAPHYQHKDLTSIPDLAGVI